MTHNETKLFILRGMRQDIINYLVKYSNKTFRDISLRKKTQRSIIYPLPFVVHIINYGFVNHRL